MRSARILIVFAVIAGGGSGVLVLRAEGLPGDQRAQTSAAEPTATGSSDDIVISAATIDASEMFTPSPPESAEPVSGGGPSEPVLSTIPEKASPTPTVVRVARPGDIGRLTGMVSIGPTCPLGGVDGCPTRSAPPPVVITIRNVSDQSVTQLTVDATNLFNVELRAGTYDLALSSSWPGTVKGLPQRVAIVGGGETHIDVELDTGIR